MQVNNNIQSPNFGMALKIGKGGREYLIKQSEEVLTKLGKIGEEMKEYKYWDFVVTENGFEAVEKGRNLPKCYAYPVILDNDAYTNLHFTDRIQFDTYVGGPYANKGEKVSVFYENLYPNEVNDVKKNFSGCSALERFAEFIKFLERRYAEDADTITAQRLKDAKINGLVDDLVSKFSVDA